MPARSPMLSTSLAASEPLTHAQRDHLALYGLKVVRGSVLLDAQPYPELWRQVARVHGKPPQWVRSPIPSSLLGSLAAAVNSWVPGGTRTPNRLHEPAGRSSAPAGLAA